MLPPKNVVEHKANLKKLPGGVGKADAKLLLDLGLFEGLLADDLSRDGPWVHRFHVAHCHHPRYALNTAAGKASGRVKRKRKRTGKRFPQTVHL